MPVRIKSGLLPIAERLASYHRSHDWPPVSLLSRAAIVDNVSPDRTR